MLLFLILTRLLKANCFRPFAALVKKLSIPSLDTLSPSEVDSKASSFMMEHLVFA